jgi:NADH-quinone oxidoreductase subunit F
LVSLYLPAKPLVWLSKVEVADVPLILDSLAGGEYFKPKACVKLPSGIIIWRFTPTGGFEELMHWHEVPFFHAQKKLVLRDAGLIDPANIAE